MNIRKTLSNINLKRALLLFTAVFVSVVYILVFVIFATLALGNGFSYGFVYAANGTFQLYNLPVAY